VIYFGWTSIFQGGLGQFTIGYAMFMLIVDSIIFCTLIFYIDSVFPTDGSLRRHPLFFLEVEIIISIFNYCFGISVLYGLSAIINYDFLNYVLIYSLL
jgi:hypothetical protein